MIFVGCWSHDLSARVYFLHVPKTGGTTVRLLLEMQLQMEEIYPFRNRVTAQYPVEQSLVSGHFPYWFCQELDERFHEAFKITILRDPIERYLSFLRSKKKGDKNLPSLESVMHLRRDPHNKYKEGLIDNAYCRYLAQNPSLEGQALLESALQTLHEVDAVVFYDHFVEDVVELFSRLGIALSADAIPKMNATEKEPVSEALLEEVKKLNYWDMQLYAYAKEHLQKKTSSYVLRTSSFAKLLQPSSHIDYTFDLPLLGTGWTYRESQDSNAKTCPPYRFVTHLPADIFFSLEQGKDYTLRFYAWPLTNAIEPQVMVNGSEIPLKRVRKALFSCYEGKIPKELLHQEFTNLSFYASKSALHQEIYPHAHYRNHPPLSFAVNRIQIGEFYSPRTSSSDQGHSFGNFLKSRPVSREATLRASS